MAKIRWEIFLQEAVGSSRQIKFLQNWMGQMLSENKRPEKLLVIVGGPGSGKTVLEKILIELAGNYRVTRLLPEAMTDFGVNASLKGKKLIVLSDLDYQYTTSIQHAAKIKVLLSGDVMCAMDPSSGKPERFRPTWGVVTTRCVGIGRDSFPLFARTFHLRLQSVKKQDRCLLNKLQRELPLIRQWALAN